MPRRTSVPDCKTCGACCWSTHDMESFCDLTHAEVDAMSPQFIAKNVRFIRIFEQIICRHPPAALRTSWRTQRAGPLKGSRACVCCQLSGSLMHKVSCKIYKDRPSVCRRAVKPGDKNCKVMRQILLQAIEGEAA